MGFYSRLILASGIGWMLDATDVLILSYLLAVFRLEWGLGAPQLALVLLANNVGMLLGASLFGRLSDIVGRRLVFMITMVLYSIFTGLSALSQDYLQFTVLRMITSLGLGGELPVASSLVSEWSEPWLRGRLVVLLESFWSLGSILAGLVAVFLIPTLGWRPSLLVLSLTGLYALGIRLLIPESPKWLVSRGYVDEARSLVRSLGLAETILVTEAGGGFGFRGLLRYGRNTLVAWTLWFTIALGYYGIFLWLPQVLVSRGFTLVSSFQYTLGMALAQVPGYFSAAYLVERVGRKPALTLYMLASAASAIAFANSTNPISIILSGTMLNFFNLGAWGIIYAYTPELYPTSIRGAGTGAAGSVGRVGMIIGPQLPIILGNFPITLAVFSASWIAAALIAQLGPETRTPGNT